MKKLLILIVLIGVLSCKKKVTISGRVYNPITDQGIAGVKIDLRRDKYGLPGSVDGSGSKFIASTTTDEDGNYFFEERLSKNRPNRMSFNYDVDLYYNIETSQKVLNTDGINQVIDFKLINTGKLAEDITDIYGHALYKTYQNSSEMNFDMDLKSGIYFISIKENDKIEQIKFIIK